MAKQTKPVAPVATPVSVVGPEGLTFDEQMSILTTQQVDAVKAKNWKLAASKAAEVAKLQAVNEAAELAIKRNALVAITDEVKAAIDKAVQPFIDDERLDIADGIWYVKDFAEQLTTCRLMKSEPRKSTGAGGKGKKFDVSISTLLNEFGSKPCEMKNKEGVLTHSGQSYQQAYDSDKDGNFRYKIRTALLKLSGRIA